LSHRSDLERLADIRAALADIRALTADGRDRFLTDRTVQQAVAYNLAVVGEAARAPSDDFRQRHGDVPWREVIGQRNVVVHEYHRLDIDRIWSTVESDIPRLDDQISRIEQVERPAPHSPEAG
jgi:uncharacterized protein with HEPN domain